MTVHRTIELIAPSGYPNDPEVVHRALQRFLRPVTFQDAPDVALPPPLRAANPWRIPRRVDGVGER